MSMLLNPTEVTVPTLAGEYRTYIISQFPATDGREILNQYASKEHPDDGTAMVKVLSYAAVRVEGREEPLRLSTPALVNAHVPDWKTLTRLENEILAHNLFFHRGDA